LLLLALQQTPKESPKVLFKIVTNHPEPKVYTFQFISPKGLIEREGIKAQVTELWAKARGATPSAMGTPAPLTPSAGIGSPGTPSAATTPSAAQSPLGNSSVASTPQLQPSTPQQLPTGASTPSSTAATPATGTPSPASSGMSLSRKQEFKDRKELLSSSRELQKLHMELVVSGKIVSEEEFWSSAYVKRYRQKLKLDAVSREGRLKGRSSRMVELKPGQQEGSDVKYTLTSQTIHNIFTEYPSASEFFHRSRTGSRSQLTPYDDIFDQCLQEEDDENAKAPDISKMDRIKRTIDLEASIEDHIEGGNAPDFTMVAGRNAQILPLIRRFNRHANLTNDAPPEKIILDIQDTSRYFESQSNEQKTNQIDLKVIRKKKKKEIGNQIG
ncbi:uncharacterized protein BX664DRAFT_262079, partial [Halteromyces radiatus]|uniref:uncharacterized protein n=1 Tax=Halteromyces radiatus TaxID=101107 RepID=UPI00221EB628